MQVDFTSLLKKLERIKTQVPLNIKQRTYQVIEEITSEIANPNSVHWKQPTYFSGPDKGSKYFSNNNTNKGLFDALAQVKSSIYVSIDDDRILFGVGDIKRLDIDTAMSNGIGYWRLFEGQSPYIGTRVGKSNNSHFLPSEGFGKRGEGTSQPGGFHPGVQSAHMFTSTLKSYRPKLNSEIKKAIREGLNAK